MSLSQKWNDLNVTKGAVAWAAAGASVLTMVVGFTWGGWVLGGTAQEMAEDAAANAHSQLAATICVDNFRNSETAGATYAELAELSGYRQRQLVEDAAWSKLPGGGEISRQAATSCATQIAELDADELALPVAAADETPSDEETVVQ